MLERKYDVVVEVILDLVSEGLGLTEHYSEISKMQCEEFHEQNIFRNFNVQACSPPF